MNSYTGKNFKINIITPDTKNNFLTDGDKEMDRRAAKAVATAIDKAKFCNKPVARYNPETKQAYIEYGDGEIKYVK